MTLDAQIQQARAEFDRLNNARLVVEMDGRVWPSRNYRQLNAARKKLAVLLSQRVEFVSAPKFL